MSMHLTDDFEVLEPPGGDSVRLRFGGCLLGEAVVWDATVMTLERAGAERNFIDVGPPAPQGRRLTVAVAAAAIDLPTLRKTVMMIRQYKRLRPGRHEYGPPRRP